MSNDNEQVRLGVRATVISWMSDEKFWRDVVTRTLSILISGLILYLLAVFSGLIQAPTGRFVIGAFVAFIVLPTAGIATPVLIVNARFRRAMREGHDAQEAHRRSLIGMKVAVPLALALGLGYMVLYRAIKWWVFDDLS